MPRRPQNYPPPKRVRPDEFPIDAFVFDHGFPGTPAGDRMKADLEALATLYTRAAKQEY